MDITITPTKLRGTVQAIPSKSQAHRLLICAAFADKPTALICPDTNRDIEATAECLCSLGARTERTPEGYNVTPAMQIPTVATLNCCESGSTLRFMLPVVGALGVDATFRMEGRLPYRPLSPLQEEMTRMGCTLTRPTEHTLRCTGKLKNGEYTVDGGVSSQFITGLLLAGALMDGQSTIRIAGKLESKPYVDMTKDAMALCGVNAENLCVSGSRPLRSPGTVQVEGDWSNGAFFLAAAAMGSCVSVTGLSEISSQGDRAAAALLTQLDTPITIDAADIPDLVPILAVTAAARQGAVFTNIRRLRLKESDRVASVIAMLKALGGCAEATEDTLTVYPCTFTGGTVDACGDHRIAMSAAIAATAATGPVTVLGCECVSKSYPGFWEEYKRLGGQYEQHIR
ncbi:MAG: 3-phosphoshikimate 1-carboxyvinyltransferase [Oscillospiraceae bacterium]|nr:3-phosphoshikimate 1-carboxyvinyltransferase [Oscillospiraceae bacterium]